MARVKGGETTADWQGTIIGLFIFNIFLLAPTFRVIFFAQGYGYNFFGGFLVIGSLAFAGIIDLKFSIDYIKSVRPSGIVKLVSWAVCILSAAMLLFGGGLLLYGILPAIFGRQIP
jgi:hypothetical protein